MTAGRPTKFKAEMIKQANILAKKGWIEAEIAEFFGVCPDTITEWKNKHAEFSASLKEGKETPDKEVEAALFKRATGYTRKVERAGKEGPQVCDEELPPDPVSCIFWLKNRQPQKWRDKQELEHSGDLTITVNLTQKTK